jgi:predicted acyltransferase
LYHGFRDSLDANIAFEPESILSTIPAVATVLIGYLMGGMLHTTKNYADCSKRMSLFGTTLIIIGLLWSIILPINKALWTSSYVLFTGGISAITLAGLTYLIDNKGIKRPFWIFEVFGTNSIFLFIISGLWVKTILAVKLSLNGNEVNAYNYLYKTLFVPILGNLNGSFFFAIFHVIGFWLILFWMQRKNINIKL